MKALTGWGPYGGERRKKKIEGEALAVCGAGCARAGVGLAQVGLARLGGLRPFYVFLTKPFFPFSKQQTQIEIKIQTQKCSNHFCKTCKIKPHKNITLHLVVLKNKIKSLFKNRVGF